MKKHTGTRLKVKLQTVRQLTDIEYRAVAGGSTIVYTCTSTFGAQSGLPTVGCPA
jgi:hypothetical protein